MEHFVDALGDMCPIPIIKAEKKLKLLAVNDLVILETDHSCSLASVTNHFNKKYGYKTRIKEVAKGIWQITIEKTR
jgi:tRNA 2-thiouridine synthesizing protein A